MTAPPRKFWYDDAVRRVVVGLLTAREAAVSPDDREIYERTRQAGISEQRTRGAILRLVQRGLLVAYGDGFVRMP